MPMPLPMFTSAPTDAPSVKFERSPAVEALDAFASPEALRDLLGDEASGVSARLWATAIHEPARTFLSTSGKGFRAALVDLGWRIGGGASYACPDELAVVLEWLHAGSLIVDDIEDGSLTRRGRPALHVSHGLPRALNTGNALYFQAQHLLSCAPLPREVRTALNEELVSTMVRCHHGQALDIAATVDALAQSEVAGVVRATTAFKTGALTRLAALFGARAAGADEPRVEAIARFGLRLGEGLQMLDDLGCLVSPRRQEKALEDLVGGHPTWVWAWLAETADPFTFTRLQSQLRSVRSGADGAALIAELRERLDGPGRARIAAHCDHTLADLRRELGDTPHLAAAEAELERLRSSYV